MPFNEIVWACPAWNIIRRNLVSNQSRYRGRIAEGIILLSKSFCGKGGSVGQEAPRT
jgi:hypothetical protein